MFGKNDEAVDLNDFIKSLWYSDLRGGCKICVKSKDVNYVKCKKVVKSLLVINR